MLQLWPQHRHAPTPPVADVRREGWWGGEPEGGGGGGEAEGVVGEAAEDVDDKATLFVPTYTWSCEHCTFVNKPGIRVCTMCCKTTTEEGQRVMRAQQKERANHKETFAKGPAAEKQAEKNKKKEEEVVSAGEESSEEESIVTAVQEMEEGSRWKSHSPRPQKSNVKTSSNFRSIAKSPSSVTSSGMVDERRAHQRRISKSPVSVASMSTAEDRSTAQFRRINRSPVSVTSTGVGSDGPSQIRRASPVMMTSTAVGDDGPNYSRRRTSRSPVRTVSTAVGDDRPSPFRRVARSPVATSSTGVGDERPFDSRRVANSPTVMTSTAVGDDRAMSARRINNSYETTTKSTATETEEVVMKVSMAVGTSPPRPMKIEKQILSKSSSMASVGTSPPPQSISTQTYDNPTALTSPPTRKTSADFGSQVSIGQENASLGGHGSLGQYGGNSRRFPRLRRTLSLTFNSKQRESTPSAFLRSQSRHSICGNSGDQSTPEPPPAVPLRRRVPSSSTTSSEYYNPSGEADGEWSGGDDDRKEGDRMHGLELVRLLREAEQHQFTAEEVEVALKQCGGQRDAKGPLAWLKANWLQMVDTVATLATNFGLERRENTVGTVSTTEAREALRKQGGDVWAAVTHCVESRQRKYAELVSRGNFTREDIVSALSNSQGNVEMAFNELSKSQLKPFLMRIWGPPVSGTGDNESGNSAIRPDSRGSSIEESSHVIDEGPSPQSSKPVKDVDESSDVDGGGEEEKVENREEEGAKVGGEGEEMPVRDVVVEAAPERPVDQGEKAAAECGGEQPAKDPKKEESEGHERMARQLLAEGHVNSYERAEIAAILVLKEGISKAEALLAVQECNSVDAALSYLRQECLLCTGEYPMNKMVSMLTCVHRCCQDCARLYFTVQIRDRSIEDAVCPFCKEPNFPKRSKDNSDIEEAAVHYYSNLDILLKAILDPKDHELFQRKLRDRTLANEANFKWCTKCSSGFISDPRQKRLVCPDCKSITCASCHRPWAQQHEGLSCDLFAQWLEENDPATQAAGLARHLAESTEAMLVCPRCRCNFSLARGGCMHLTCPQCRHEFCSGCDQTFAMGTQCMDGARGEEEEGTSVAVVIARGGHPCARLGLHAHHPRDCLFYLRDMEPVQLQKLLTDNNIEFNRKNPDPTNDTGNMKCQVQVQREGPTGLLDGICDEDVPKDHAGLCRLHYIEYLVGVMRRAGLDPAPAFDQHEAIAELRRRNVPPPDRPQGMVDAEYRQLCVEVIQKMIPLKTVNSPNVKEK
ncbi:E3 ubiquitin-protein ligase lubel-like isoform X2 [Ischnura elegans]|uniref:E3 ubiquitin-protein ligase lubel-like isoform X2 n=1 Tax=Ischnura elegans TaxID=197161 RepID=UPI001ED89CBF|nr:E3 ubiquitin-protein ligase lubel-like isoform X2 [Ischnura elegans]